MSAPTPCRFVHLGCRDKAAGRYTMDRGCACFPDDREQDLCTNHALQSEPLGSMILVTVYDAGGIALLGRAGAA